MSKGDKLRKGADLKAYRESELWDNLRQLVRDDALKLEGQIKNFRDKELKEVQEITESWVTEYNEERPHESLGNLTPKEYLAVNQ